MSTRSPHYTAHWITDANKPGVYKFPDISLNHEKNIIGQAHGAVN
jgi:hypothetical protein